jgi:uncharacterized membrane protein YqgA involved in biofilm formation
MLVNLSRPNAIGAMTKTVRNNWKALVSRSVLDAVVVLMVVSFSKMQ